MEELREVRRWREEFGMGTRGGVVRVAEPEPSSDAPDQERPDPSVPRGATLEVSLDWDEDENQR